jgi:hypothetical protein
VLSSHEATDPIEPHRTKGRGSGASNRFVDLGHRVQAPPVRPLHSPSSFLIRRTVHSALGCVYSISAPVAGKALTSRL